MKKGNPPKILCVRYNDEAKCIAIGTSDGVLRILREKSLNVLYERSGEERISCVAMLGTSSLLAMAGSASNKNDFTKRQMRLLNTKSGKVLHKLSFKTAILNIELSEKCIAVLLENKIVLYDTRRLRHLKDVPTSYNTRGLGKIVILSSSTKHDTLLVYPAENDKGIVKGFVGVLDCSRICILSRFKTHDSNISTIAVCNRIEAMATASEKGTLVRVFRIPSGEILYTFRRGSVVCT